MEAFTSIERLSHNQITTNRWSLQEAADGCMRAGISWIGLWRHKVQETGLAESRRIIRDSGLGVSSLCRGGMFPAETAAGRQANLDDNRRAVEEAAELGTDVLVLVCGGLAGKDLESSRQMVTEGIAQLAPYAQACKVKLAIEPLHPMFAADRSVIVTLGQALAMAEPFAADQVGVIVDVFHVWWDPELYAGIQRAGSRIFGFHVNDWLNPLPDVLMGRGMMGDGVMQLRRMRQAVDLAGYSGPIEAEIFNRGIWDRPGDEVLALMKERFLQHC